MDNNIKPNIGSMTRSKRLGRGRGSTFGKTCGKGSKGQRVRSGRSVPLWFEGGQTPLYRRVPKKGFNNIFKKQWEIVNIDSLFAVSDQLKDIQRIDIEVINRLTISQKKPLPIKLLAGYSAKEKSKLSFLKGKTIAVHAISKNVKEILSKASVKIEILPTVSPKQPSVQDKNE